MSASTSMPANQRPKQRQRPSAAGQVEPSTSGDGTAARRRVNSTTTTKATRNPVAPTRVTRKATNQMTAVTRSTSASESTADMFTAKSRYTHVSKGVQAQTRDTHENTHDMLSPPLTRSNSMTRTSDIHTRSRSRAHTNPMGRTASNPRTKGGSFQKSKALSSLENLV